MNEERIKIALDEEMAKCGYQCKIMAGNHIYDLQSEIENQYHQGLFDEEFYKEELAGFDFNIKNSYFRFCRN